MGLPNEIKDRQWAQAYLKEIEGMSLEELFNEALGNAAPDDLYGGYWTTRGWWKAEISQMQLWERIKHLDQPAASESISA